MPNYKETPVAGTQYQRSHQVRIDNPLGGIPSVHFAEQQIVALETGRYDQTVPGMDFNFDPTLVIPLLNPNDDSPLGSSVTGQDVYVIIYSLYKMKAAQRDAGLPL